jgi:hypothetical protein
MADSRCRVVGYFDNANVRAIGERLHQTGHVLGFPRQGAGRQCFAEQFAQQSIGEYLAAALGCDLNGPFALEAFEKAGIHPKCIAVYHFVCPGWRPSGFAFFGHDYSPVGLLLVCRVYCTLVPPIDQ